MCELGACLCNIPKITNKNRYEQQIDQGNKIGLKFKIKIVRNSPPLHLDVVCVLESKRIERNGNYCFGGLKMTINKRVKGTHLHYTWMLISLVLLIANRKKKRQCR